MDHFETDNFNGVQFCRFKAKLSPSFVICYPMLHFFRLKFQSLNQPILTVRLFPDFQSCKLGKCQLVPPFRLLEIKRERRPAVFPRLSWFSKHTAGRGLSGRFAKLFKTAAHMEASLHTEPLLFKMPSQVFLQSVSH